MSENAMRRSSGHTGYKRKRNAARNGYMGYAAKIAEIATRISVRMGGGFGRIDEIGLFLNIATQFANAGAAIVPSTHRAR